MNWINFINTYGIILPIISVVKQKGKIVVMTGGNRGIGIHVLNKLLQCDITVMLDVRDPEAAKIAIESSIESSLTKGKLFYETCDLGDLNSVRQFAMKVQDKFSAIYILINQAGAFSESYRKTKDLSQQWKSIIWTPERGSRAIVYGAISPDIEGNGGTYLSNCRVSRTYGIVNDEYECGNFTRKLLKVDDFGKLTNLT